jgi:alkaline phosphatase
MAQPRETSRREFLRFAGLGSVALGSAAVPALAATHREAGMNAAGAQAKNVIFMVADGMNIAALSLADAWSRRVRSVSSRWIRLYRERPVVRALCETHSATGLVTDSAAAASAWGIGERVANGSLNVTPDGRKPVTLAQKMKAARKRVGLVTTATATHATPAGFAVTVASRRNQAEVAAQYLERGVDVILGGGADYFSPSLLETYRKMGYAVTTDAAQLIAYTQRPTTPLLGLFSPKYIPYEFDRLRDPVLKSKVPSLANMTQAALNSLQGAPEGFFLMVEGGRVDHAAHANDALALIHDQLAFDEAIETVLAFADRSPDTLVVITTDHGTGGIQLNGVGDEDFEGAPAYAGTNEAFRRLDKFTATQEATLARVKGQPKQVQLDALLASTGLEFKPADLAKVTDLKTFQALLPKQTGINWTSNNHTADLVEFCAFGPGAGLFGPFLRNDEVHAKVLRAVGVSG